MWDVNRQAGEEFIKVVMKRKKPHFTLKEAIKFYSAERGRKMSKESTKDWLANVEMFILFPAGRALVPLDMEGTYTIDATRSEIRKWLRKYRKPAMDSELSHNYARLESISKRAGKKQLPKIARDQYDIIRVRNQL